MLSRKPSDRRRRLGVGLFGDQLGDLDLNSERLYDLSGGGRNACGADDRCDRRKHTADPVAVDAQVRCGFQVQDVGDRRRVELDQSGDADERQCFRVEARRRERGRGHVGEQVEDWGVVCWFGHRAFLSFDNLLLSASGGGVPGSNWVLLPTTPRPGGRYSWWSV